MEYTKRPDIRLRNARGDLESPSVSPPVIVAIGGDGITPYQLRHDAIFQTHFDGGVIGISDVTTEVWVVKNFDAGEIT